MPMTREIAIVTQWIPSTLANQLHTLKTDKAIDGRVLLHWTCRARDVPQIHSVATFESTEFIFLPLV